MRILVIAAAGVAILYFASISALSYYDARTKRHLLQTVERELRVGASKEEMTEFLRRHTSRFALDEEYNREYGGFIPQTEWDRFLFDRQVQILFRVSPTGTLKDTEIRVFYTAL